MKQSFKRSTRIDILPPKNMSLTEWRNNCRQRAINQYELDKEFNPEHYIEEIMYEARRNGMFYANYSNLFNTNNNKYTSPYTIISHMKKNGNR